MNTETKTAMDMLNAARRELESVEFSRLASLSSALELATKQVNELFAGQVGQAQEKVRLARSKVIESAEQGLPTSLKDNEITVKGIRDLLTFVGGVVGYEVVSKMTKAANPNALIRVIHEPYFSVIHDVKTSKGDILVGKFKSESGGRMTWHTLRISPYQVTEVMVRKIQTKEEKRIQRQEEFFRRNEREAAKV